MGWGRQLCLLSRNVILDYSEKVRSIWSTDRDRTEPRVSFGEQLHRPCCRVTTEEKLCEVAHCLPRASRRSGCPP
ncbi:rCG44047, partial [Rattus norvegicus]